MSSTTYERVTERILELLERGVCPWRQPWSIHHEPPQNFVSKRPYNGMNFLLLNCAGFESPFFMTFRQVQELEGAVKKGSRGFPVVYWGTIEGETKAAARSPEAAGETKTIPFLRSYTVFNAAQIDGIEFPAIAKRSVEFNPIQRAEEIVNGWKDGPKTLHGTKRACYNVTSDEINLPFPQAFQRPEDYYSTRFHEMGHATGAPHRLARKIANKFGDHDYCREELVAEMTAAYLGAKCGIDSAVVENQAAYLQGWIEVLRADPKAVVIAAGQAQRAANAIQGITPEIPKIADRDMAFTKQLYGKIGKALDEKKRVIEAPEIEIGD